MTIDTYLKILKFGLFIVLENNTFLYHHYSDCDGNGSFIIITYFKNVHTYQ